MLLRSAILVAALTLTCSVASAQEESAPDQQKAPPMVLKRPQDFAPSVQVIIPRPPEEYLPKDSLLAGGTHTPRQVDRRELYLRVLRMYAGSRETESLPSVPGAAFSGPAMPAVDSRPQEFDLAPWVFWSVISVSVIVTSLLLTRVCMSFISKPAVAPGSVATRTAPPAPGTARFQRIR